VTVDELAEILANARRAVVSTASALFLGMRSYREPDAEAFARQVLPLVLAGQRTIAQVVAIYTAEAAQEATVSTARPIGISIPPPAIPDVDVVGRLGDTDFQVVYQRPFVTVWAELARRAPADPARVPDPVEVEGSMTRAVDKGDMDAVSVHPLPAHERLLEALLRLGFRFARADATASMAQGSCSQYSTSRGAASWSICVKTARGSVFTFSFWSTTGTGTTIAKFSGGPW